MEWGLGLELVGWGVWVVKTEDGWWRTSGVKCSFLGVFWGASGGKIFGCE